MCEKRGCVFVLGSNWVVILVAVTAVALKQSMDLAGYDIVPGRKVHAFMAVVSCNGIN